MLLEHGSEKSTAVIAQAGGIMKGSFGVVPDDHAGVFLLGFQNEIALLSYP
jgi:hypothetical protein